MALTRLISLLMLLLTSTLSWATSYIYVTNTTPEVVSVSSVQYGDKQLTKGTHWGTYDTVIPAYATRKVLWMNRNTGITSGKYFYFDTTITANGSQVVLQQKLKGNLIGSSIWHSAKASSFSNPWFDDRNIHNNNFSYNNRNSVMSFKAEATSGYDDFYYVTHNNNHVEPVSSNANELKVLTYNLWTLIGAELKCERLKDVASAIKGYDVIVFEEAFENACREQLMNDIRAEYPYQTLVVDNTSNLLEDGGVIAVSRHPIAVEDQRVFPNCNGYICLSNRGFVYLELLKNGVPYHVVGVHTQAYNGDVDRAVRLDQIGQMRDFITARNIPNSEAVVYAGDMNVDKYATPTDYTQMLSILNADAPMYVGHPFTYDPQTNSYATETQEYLDYVLIDKRYRQGSNTNTVRIYRGLSPAVWLKHDLSDHYAVAGQLNF